MCPSGPARSRTGRAKSRRSAGLALTVGGPAASPAQGQLSLRQADGMTDGEGDGGWVGGTGEGAGDPGLGGSGMADGPVG